MRYTLPIAIAIIVVCAPSARCFSQDSTSFIGRLTSIPNRIFGKITHTTADLDKQVERQTEKVLERMQKREARLRVAVAKKDSIRAQQLFARSEARYQALEAKIRQPVDNTVAHPLKEYLPKLDSLQTAFGFLQQKNIQLPTDKLQQLQSASGELQELQARLQVADEAQAFMRQREQQLREQLSTYDLKKQLLGLNKETYYYQAQLLQYKSMINDPDKWQQAILSRVRDMPSFQHFWQKNSYWGQLFPAPPNEGTPQALAGLQTREQVQKDLQQKFGVTTINISDKGGGGGTGYLQQQMQQTQTVLNAIRNKLSQFGGGSNMTMPDFQPNSQRVKTFLKRLQYDVSIQNNASTSLLPAISTVSLNIGYKISDKTTAGIGVNYLLGLGNGLSHIRISNQGIGGKTFVDIKAKGSIWISGGLEYNYMQQFAGLQSIWHIDIWQKSVLVGVTKKYRIGKKENKLQLLYDFMAAHEIPRGQTFQFRTGFGF